MAAISKLEGIHLATKEASPSAMAGVFWRPKKANEGKSYSMDQMAGMLADIAMIIVDSADQVDCRDDWGPALATCAAK